MKALPPPLELACLTVLWKRGDADVAEVREALMPSRTLAYTTVMTVLERLASKGMVTREKSGRCFRYSPARKRDELRTIAIGQLAEQFFDGSFEEFERFFGEMLSRTSPAPERDAFSLEDPQSPPSPEGLGERASGSSSPNSSSAGSTLDASLL
ncbi:MAG: BlaI/MecI/CopY family transcriptional regulator [Bryobacterales bacterium]|nr:BlaI/MecI/CopY family transcriptional regulator [Bryobacterales bacterium]